MTVLLLDDRWPSMIPLEAYGRLAGPVSYTDEVPVTVRWNFGDLVRPDGPGVLVSTNERDPRVAERVDAGEDVIEAPSRQDPVRDALHAMTRARSMGEWEASQTHDSLLPYLAEETREFAEAVGEWGETGDEAQLCRELGDVLLQVFFQADIGAQYGTFELSDVTTAICRKMIARHTHIFGSAHCDTAEEVAQSWERMKQQQRGNNTIASMLADVSSDLPALLRAEKVLKKLQANGLDYQALLADDPSLPLLRKVDALRGQSLCAEESVHLALKRLIEAVEKQEK